MNPRDVRILTECDTMLDTCARRYAYARRRLAEVEPGYPAYTPGAGEPGGGSSFTNGSITSRLADRTHRELLVAVLLDQAPKTIAAHAAYLANSLKLAVPDPANSPRWSVQLLVWSRWAIRQLIAAQPDDIPSSGLEALHGSIVHLHRLVTKWGTKPAPPKKAVDEPDALPTDLTGDLCRSCLRVGSRSTRYRGELCGWCYDLACAIRAAVHGAAASEVAPIVPPLWVMEARRDGKKVTEQMFLTAVKAEREKLKPKGKRKRRA